MDLVSMPLMTFPQSGRLTRLRSARNTVCYFGPMTVSVGASAGVRA